MKAVPAIAALLAFLAPQPALAASQAALDRFAAGLGVRLEVVDNRPARCPQGSSGCFLSELTLTVPARLAPDLAAGRFKIYFSSVSPVIRADSPAFRTRLVNGDLHVLEPRPGVRLRAGRAYPIKLWSNGHFFSAYYPMPNMYLVSGSLEPRVIAATRPVIDPATGLELLPFVAPMTDEARLATGSTDDDTRWWTPERLFEINARRPVAPLRPEFAIIPTPALVRRLPGPALDLTRGVRLFLSGTGRPPIAAALGRLGVPAFDRGPRLSVRVTGRGASESYRIVAGHSAGAAITIEAADSAGASHALRSLSQQLAHEGGRLRPLMIEDAPRLPFRGLHLDLARNFHSKREVLALVEQMGAYKLNKLHLHLGDDEGWRLQIRPLPELTEVGAYRCHDPAEDRCLLPQLGAGPFRETPVNGYLSEADYREVLLAAKARGIEVIPSFDMPGHSRAAIRSMEARYRRLMALGRKPEAEEYRLAEPGDRTRYRSIQNYDDNTLNVCLDSTYRFVDAVLGELGRMHSQAGTPLRTYHIGADETAGAWSQSPACKAMMARTGLTVDKLGPMFIERVSNSLAAKGIAVAGWSDGIGHVNPANMPAAVQSNIWSDLLTSGPAEAHRHANHGWKSVISVPNVLYLDMPYAPDPLERGYDWASRGTDTFKVFSFLPENLPANASVMRDLRNKAATVKDGEPLAPGRRMSGLQAQLWSETVRSDALVDYMLFPRLLAFAERAWHRGEWETPYRPGAAYAFGDGKVDGAALQADWGRFAQRMGGHLHLLDRAGIAYRIAPPGARISRGMLEANSEFPGQAIEYRVRGGQWAPFAGPVRVGGAVEVRTRSGNRVSRTVVVRPTNRRD